MIQGLVLLFAPVLTVYASPGGSDRKVGTLQAPVRSLERAVAIARTQGGAPRRIVLAPGDYPVADTVELGPKDDGLTIVGAGKARLLGGRSVTGWKRAVDPRLAPEARDKVKVVDLKAAGLTPGELRLRGFHDGKAASALELFFEGKPQTLARWPNLGGYAGEYVRTGVPTGPKGFAHSETEPKRWSTPNDPWIFGYLRLDWCDTYDKVVRLDADAGTVELSREPDYGIEAGRRFFFFNVLEELDTPGEYFVDRRAGKLFYWPPAPKGDVVASLIEGPMFRLKGASNVTLKGLRLEAGRDGAVWIEGGRGNRVDSCLIRNFGTYGVSIHDATDSGVAHCDLTGLGSRGFIRQL